MRESREEIGMKKHVRMKVVRSRLGWTGHIQGLSAEILTKIAWDTNRVVEGEQEGRS